MRRCVLFSISVTKYGCLTSICRSIISWAVPRRNMALSSGNQDLALSIRLSWRTTRCELRLSAAKLVNGHAY